VFWVERAIINDGTFALPSKRELTKDGSKTTAAIVDVTECAAERPKKNKKSPIRARKNSTR
jgi:hypothetical protein